MDVEYYYQILDTGIVYEKGRKRGERWRLGERKRLREEILFWQSLLEFISLEKRGIDCSAKLFQSLDSLCRKYKLPNYERILKMKIQLVNDTCIFERKREDEINIYNLMNCLIKDIQTALNVSKDKEVVYRMLTVLHNLPKAMHGQNILSEHCDLISCNDALLYAQGCMDEKMKEKYKEYFIK
jgi:hypothetical protein